MRPAPNSLFKNNMRFLVYVRGYIDYPDYPDYPDYLDYPDYPDYPDYLFYPHYPDFPAYLDYPLTRVGAPTIARSQQKLS